MTSCGRILLPFVAKCFCTYAHTRRHTLEIRNASKLLRLTKFSSRLRYPYYIQEKEEVTHQKNKPIVTQFVHICFSQCEKNVPDFGQIRISCIQTFRMGGSLIIIIKSNLCYSECNSEPNLLRAE